MRSGSNMARISPAHKIFPGVAKVLPTQMDSKTVFADHIVTKPAALEAQWPIHDAFQEMRKQIILEIKTTVETRGERASSTTYRPKFKA